MGAICSNVCEIRPEHPPQVFKRGRIPSQLSKVPVQVIDQGGRQETISLNSGIVGPIENGAMEETLTQQGFDQDTQQEAYVVTDDSLNTPHSDDGELAVSGMEEKSSMLTEDKPLTPARVTGDQVLPSEDAAEKPSTSKVLEPEIVTKANIGDRGIGSHMIPVDSELVVSVLEKKSSVDPEDKPAILLPVTGDQVLPTSVELEDTTGAPVLVTGTTARPNEDTAEKPSTPKVLDSEILTKVNVGDYEIRSPINPVDIKSSVQAEDKPISPAFGVIGQVLTSKGLGGPNVVKQELLTKENIVKGEIVNTKIPADSGFRASAMDEKSSPWPEDKPAIPGLVPEDQALPKRDTPKHLRTVKVASQGAFTKKVLADYLIIRNPKITADGLGVSVIEEKSTVQIEDNPLASEKHDQVLSTEDTAKHSVNPKDRQGGVLPEVAAAVSPLIPSKNELAVPVIKAMSSTQSEGKLVTQLVAKEDKVLPKDDKEMKHKEQIAVVDQEDISAAIVTTGERVSSLIPESIPVSVPNTEEQSST